MRRKNGSELVKNEKALLKLVVANKGPIHGWELLNLFAEQYDPNVAHSTIYRCLARLDDRKLVTAVWEHQQRGVPRRLYTATELGITEANQP